MFHKLLKLEQKHQQIADELLARSRAMDTVGRSCLQLLGTYRKALREELEKPPSNTLNEPGESNTASGSHSQSQRKKQDTQRTAQQEQDSCWESLKDAKQEFDRLYKSIQAYQSLLESIRAQIRNLTARIKTQGSKPSIIARLFGL